MMMFLELTKGQTNGRHGSFFVIYIFTSDQLYQIGHLESMVLDFSTTSLGGYAFIRYALRTILCLFVEAGKALWLAWASHASFISSSTMFCQAIEVSIRVDIFYETDKHFSSLGCTALSMCDYLVTR